MGPKSARSDQSKIARITIVGSPYTGSPPAVVLLCQNFGTAKFLFNVPEGFQRIISEQKFKISGDKLNHIFFTQTSSETFGGFPGLYITLSNLFSTKLNLIAPQSQNLRKILQTGHSFLRNDRIPLNFIESTENNSECGSKRKASSNYCFENEHLCVQAVHLKSSDPQSDQVPTMAQQFPPEKLVDCKGPGSVVSYICDIKGPRGKFNVEKAKAMGLGPGREYSRLTSGESVTLQDGTVIRPEDVVEPALKGSTIAIIDCSSKAFLKSLIESKDFDFANREYELAIHLTPADVMEEQDYISWMQMFGSQTEHIITNTLLAKCEDVFGRSRSMQERMHNVDSDMFPLLFNLEAPFTRFQFPSNLKVTGSQNLMSFDMTPKKRGTSGYGFDVSHVQGQISIIKDLMGTTEFKSLAAEFAQLKQRVKKVDPLSPEISFFGTGSSVPSTYRNVSGITLRLNNNQDMLFLDAGEGTWNQMIRRYGIKLATKHLMKTKLFWISHLHADHHIGLLRLLEEYAHHNDTEIPLVIGPRVVLCWLEDFARISRKSIRFIGIPNQYFDPLSETRISENTVSALEKLGMEEWVTARVRHCMESYGICMKHSSGWKLVYSGDTVPCENLIRLGKDASILIHEATFCDDMLMEAKKKQHSTASQAIQVGCRMNAEFIILTHFSSRYRTMQSIVNSIPDHKIGSVAIAKDFTRFKFSDLCWAGHTSKIVDMATRVKEEEP